MWWPRMCIQWRRIRGGWTWYTGAAGWMYRAALEGLLGISRQGNMLRIAPCLPPQWPGYQADLTVEQSRYQLQLTQCTSPDQPATVVLDGQDVSGQHQYLVAPGVLLLPLDGQSHQVCWQLQPAVAGQQPHQPA